MQVVILCGGKGTRLSELTEKLPKPLIEIGGKPILVHVMEHYAKHGHTDFILCVGYKGAAIQSYFESNTPAEWNVTCVDTGEDASKCDRLRAVRDQIKGDTFCLGYGDDISDVDVAATIAQHKESGVLVTLTATPLVSPFGIIDIDSQVVTQFKEKPVLDHYMNGAFYVCSTSVIDEMNPGDDFEAQVLEKIAKDKKVGAYKHTGFWKSMNTLKDVNELNEMFDKGETPWA